MPCTLTGADFLLEPLVLPLSSEHGRLLSIDPSDEPSSTTGGGRGRGGNEVVTCTGSRVSMSDESVESVALGTIPLAQESIVAGTGSVWGVCVCVRCVCGYMYTECNQLRVYHEVEDQVWCIYR